MCKDAEIKIQNLAQSLDTLLSTNSAEYKKYKRKSIIAKGTHKMENLLEDIFTPDFIFFMPVIILVVAMIAVMIIY